jgi:hypothetical protein
MFFQFFSFCIQVKENKNPTIVSFSSSSLSLVFFSFHKPKKERGGGYLYFNVDGNNDSSPIQ